MPFADSRTPSRRKKNVIVGKCVHGMRKCISPIPVDFLREKANQKFRNKANKLFFNVRHFTVVDKQTDKKKVQQVLNDLYSLRDRMHRDVHAQRALRYGVPGKYTKKPKYAGDAPIYGGRPLSREDIQYYIDLARRHVVNTR